MKKLLFVPILLLGFFACKNDNVVDLTPTEEICDTLEIDFATDVEPILSNNCYVCHGTETSYAGFNFTNYDDVVTAAKAGRLSGAINHKDGYKPMPNGRPQLDQCSISKIDAWITTLK